MRKSTPSSRRNGGDSRRWRIQMTQERGQPPMAWHLRAKQVEAQLASMAWKLHAIEQMQSGSARLKRIKKFLCSAVASLAGVIGAPSKTWSRIMREWTELHIQIRGRVRQQLLGLPQIAISVNVGVTVAGVTVEKWVIQSARAARCCLAWAFSAPPLPRHWVSRNVRRLQISRTRAEIQSHQWSRSRRSPSSAW